MNPAAHAVWPSLMRLLALIAAASLLVACQRDQAEAPDATVVLATVGDVVISAAQFEDEMNRRARMRPGYFDRVAHRRQLLDELIDHQAQINAAKAAGLDQDPEFRALIERMLIQRLREARLEQALADLEVSDEEIEAYWQAHPGEFGRPERRQLAMIRVDLPARLDADSLRGYREQLQSIRAEALALPEDVSHFGGLAVSHSSDRGSRYQGGVVGWLVRHPDHGYRWPGPVLEAAFALTEGEVSEVLETDEAMWLLRLVRYEPERRMPLESVADGIRHRLLRERAGELEQSLMAEARNGQAIAIHESVFDAIPVPAAGPPPEREEPRRPPPLPALALDSSDLATDSGNGHD